ncbi:hypothetical protein [Halobacteriovorax sp. JY17]|uniref:hypothetical protein n=1 Tax=Halobacteriovorax sp. JY17 TaxID=2014617 RepID=UPI000C4362C6|nr:hypothetical protein [Halobacteriovorax sp. JY17]PIK15985.1 MAG: hypothetical protein CES88_04450 [Halobacteriovorax sp. JY17]
MKKLSILILAVLSFSSFAHKYVGMNVPTMLMENGFEFESVKVTNICQTADGSFKTIKKATNKCVTYSRNFRNAFEYREASNGCLRTGSLHLFASESKRTSFCAEYGREDGEYGCIRIGHSSEQRPLSYTVQKVRWNTRGGMNNETRVIDEVLESYTHTIPACN